jgi:cytochrome c553
MLVVAIAGLAGSCSRSSPEGSTARAREVYQLCAQCHGTDGAGNRALGAPAIAGLDAWYVEAQLFKFKQGVRGAHPDDAAGLRMRPMALSLRSDRDIKEVAAHVAQMPPNHAQPVVTGDAARGQTLWGTCAACHGQNGAGNRATAAPPLDRGSDWYQVAQLDKFKRGLRGAHPDDTSGSVMRSIALTLEDEQAMNDVVTYITTLR